MKKGWYWPVALATFLGIVVVAYAVMVYVAVSDPSFAVERDYYAKSLAWDSTMAQERRNADLGWRLAVDIAPSSAARTERVTVRLRDRAGAPIENAVVDVEAFHNARANAVLTATFAAVAGQGYVAEMPIRRAGLWEFRFHVHRGAETFTTTLTRELGAR